MLVYDIPTSANTRWAVQLLKVAHDECMDALRQGGTQANWEGAYHLQRAILHLIRREA
jgi:hypothetical protein